MLRHTRFVSVLLVAVVVPVCLVLVLFSVVLASASATAAPIGGAVASDSQSHTTQTTQASTPADDSTGPCDWVINIFGEHHIDVCFPLRLIVGAGAFAVRNVYHAVAKQVNFLWSTPLPPFQDDSQGGLITVWNTSWSIVLACVTAVIAWAGLRYAVGSVLSWLSYANLIELIPRLLFALLAAFFSKEFFIMLIQANNALAGIFNTNALNVIMDQTTSGIINNLMQILYGVLAFVLILEGAARIAVIYLLFAFAPILFFLAALRETQHWAKNAAVAAILFIFLQAIQAGALDVGGRIMTSVLHSKPNDLTFLNLLVSIAIMYVTLTLFFGITRMALGRGGDVLASAPFIAAAGSVRAARGTLAGVGNAARGARSMLQPLPHPRASVSVPGQRPPIALGTKGGAPPPSRPQPGGPATPKPPSGGPGSGGTAPGPKGKGTNAISSPTSPTMPAGPGPKGRGASFISSATSPTVPGTGQKTPLALPAGKGRSPSSASPVPRRYTTMPPLRRAGHPPGAQPEPPRPGTRS